MKPGADSIGDERKHYLGEVLFIVTNSIYYLDQQQLDVSFKTEDFTPFFLIGGKSINNDGRLKRPKPRQIIKSLVAELNDTYYRFE